MYSICYYDGTPWLIRGTDSVPLSEEQSAIIAQAHYSGKTLSDLSEILDVWIK